MKICYKVSLSENFQLQSCKAFIGLSLSNRAQMVDEGCPFYLKFWAKVTHTLQKRRLPIDIRWYRIEPERQHLANNTNRKSTTSFPMSLRWTAYVAPKPQRRAQKREVSIFRINVDLSR